MTREEAKTVFLNRGYVEVEGGTIYDADKWREACRVISEWLEQEPSGDLISRQDAIKAIDEKAKRIKNADTLNGLAGAVGILFDLPSVKPQTGHWIPVSERLPEEDGDYFVTYEKGYAEDYNLPPIGIVGFEVDCESFGYWHEHFDRQTLGSLGSEWEEIKVIAWMPLPEPWKGEKA